MTNVEKVLTYQKIRREELKKLGLGSYASSEEGYSRYVEDKQLLRNNVRNRFYELYPDARYKKVKTDRIVNESTCGLCGKGFVATETQKFCSRKCYRDSRLTRYDGINWEMMRDVEIAKKLGITKEAARHVRKNKPKFNPAYLFQIWFLEHKYFNWLLSLPPNTILKLYTKETGKRFSYYYLTDFLAEKNIRLSQTKSLYSKSRFINWALRNKDISEIYGLNKFHVGTERNRLKKGKSIWLENKNPDEYQLLVEAEKNRKREFEEYLKILA